MKIAFLALVSISRAGLFLAQQKNAGLTRTCWVVLHGSWPRKGSESKSSQMLVGKEEEWLLFIAGEDHGDVPSLYLYGAFVRYMLQL